MSHKAVKPIIDEFSFKDLRNNINNVNRYYHVILSILYIACHPVIPVDCIGLSNWRKKWVSQGAFYFAW